VATATAVAVATTESSGSGSAHKVNWPISGLAMIRDTDNRAYTSVRPSLRLSVFFII